MCAESVQQINELFDIQRHRVEKLRKIAQQQGDAEADALLRQAWLRLRQGPVRTLVMGVSSAGKSTLINALVQNIVVPEGNYTTSPIPVWIYSGKYSNQNPYTTIIEEQDGEFLKKTTSQYGHITKYCYNPSQAGAGAGQREFENTISAAINVDSGIVSESGITLIDTPGIEASQADNDKVQQALIDGCELLIVVAHNYQDQNVKEYLRDLLLAEDAPLGPLLDDSRVFMVLNTHGHYSAHAKLDAEHHIVDTFEGRFSNERLFVFNALDARLTSCGVYPYPSVMPDGFNMQDREQAEASMKQEESRLANAVHPEKMEPLREELVAEAEYLCSDPDEIDRIWNPIQEKIDAAVSLLKAPLEQQRKQVEDASYPAPPDLQKVLEKVDLHSREMQDLAAKVKQVLTAGTGFSEQHFPMHTLLKGLYRHESMNEDTLLTDLGTDASQFLEKQIKKPDGPVALAHVIERQLFKHRQQLLSLLESDRQNAEHKYWQDWFRTLQEQLRFVDASDSTSRQEALEKLNSSIEAAYRSARNAGVTALQESCCFCMTMADIWDLEQYLEKQKMRLHSGGVIRRTWNSFMFYANVSIDKLRTLLRDEIQKGTEAYMEGFRKSFWSSAEELYALFDDLLAQITAELDAQRSEIEEQIFQFQEHERKAALERIDHELKELDN